jgi:hypothetical protein
MVFKHGHNIIAILSIKRWSLTRHWGLTPIILATWKAEIKRIAFQGQPGKTVHETLSQKYPKHTEKGWWSGSRGRV